MTRQKLHLDKDVVSAAFERLEHVYATHDVVCVQVSGGKDSAAVAALMKAFHEKHNLGKVRAIFRDEEMVSPSVVKWLEWLREEPWIDLEWYCLGPDTEVVTRGGVRRISDLAGGCHELMTERGKWVKAPVSSFGRRPVKRITFRRNGRTKEVLATPDHRWFALRRKTVDGSTWSERTEVTTDELRVGDRMVGVWKTRHVKAPSPFGVAHGFTFGDGNRAGNGCQVTLHGEKDRALKPFFDGHLTSTSSGGRRDGVPQPRAIGLPYFFKNLPSLDEAPSYLYGWLAGYFAADGCVTASGKLILGSVSREHLEFVRTLCTNLGIFTYEIRHSRLRTFGADRDFYEVTISGEDLNEAFFIIEHHRSRWLAAGQSKRRNKRLWTVVSIEDAGEAETFCAVVDGTHSFVLADHLLTGNCMPQGQEIWVLGRREYVLLWSGQRRREGRLVREVPPWAITAEHFGLDPDKPIPESIDYYTMQGKKGKVAFVTGVRANESMIRYRSVVQKLNEPFLVKPYRMKKSIPLWFAKVIYDWTTDDVFKFLDEQGMPYCEYYDLAALTGSNTRVGIPLHAVAIRRIGDVIATEPEFYDRLVECFPQIDAQRRYWPDFDIEALIQYYTEQGWDGVRECIDDNFLTDGYRRRALAYAAEFRKKQPTDPAAYPLHWLIRNLLMHELNVTAVNPIGPGTKAYNLQKAIEQAEADSLDLIDDMR